MIIINNNLKSSLLIILLILLSLSTYSQIKLPHLKIEAIFPEIYVYNDDKFSQFLVENDLPKFSHPNASLGVNFSVIAKNFTFSAFATGHNVAKPDQNSDTTIIYGIGTLSARVGYQLHWKKNITIEPFLGLRNNYLNYAIEAKEDKTLKDFIVNNSRGKEIKYNQNYLEIGASIDYGELWTIGISSGLLVPIGESQWYVDNSKISNDFDIEFKSFIVLKAGMNFSLCFK